MKTSRLSFLSLLGLSPLAPMLAPRLDDPPAGHELPELEAVGRKPVEPERKAAESFVFSQALRALAVGRLGSSTPLRARLLGEENLVGQLRELDRDWPEAEEFPTLAMFRAYLDVVAGPEDLSNITWSRRGAASWIDSDDVTFPWFSGPALGVLVSWGEAALERPFVFVAGGFPVLGHPAIDSCTVHWSSGGFLRTP